MDDKKPVQSQINKSQLANELIYRKYLFGNDNFRGYFKDLQIMEYVFLHTIIDNFGIVAIESKTWCKIYINVSCGNRGKQDSITDADGNTVYTGDAPSCLVAQKAAARFVKYNILLGNLYAKTSYH